MIVTAIVPSGKQKVKVTFDDRLTLVLYKGELKSYHLREGSEVPDDLPDRLQRELLGKRAAKYAMNLLVKKDYTARELERKLQQAGYTGEALRQGVGYVVSYGYINDESYAKRYLESLSDRRSLKQMKTELRSKGIAEEVLEAAMEEAQMRDERELLKELAEKKAASLDLRSEKDRQKLLRFLMSKGFSYGDVREVVSGYFREDEVW